MLGKFISIEGPDGAGKSTLAAGLRDEVRDRGIDCVLTREPGHGPVGAEIRAILLEGKDIDSWTEVFLFLADRRQHVEGLVRPALESGKWVICDRYADSTIVYQGYGRDLDVGLLKKLNKIATSGLMPDRTLLVDLDPAIALARMTANATAQRSPNPSRAWEWDRGSQSGVGGGASARRGAQPNRLDREPIEFHRRVREGFLAEAQLDPQRFSVVNGDQTPEALLADALGALTGA